MKKKIGFISLGCAKNLTDTETMLSLVCDGGMEVVANPEDADIIVVNTCAFIDSAKSESIEAILEMAQYKKKADSVLVVTGCLAQRYKEQIITELPEVDIVLGTNDYNKIVSAVNKFYTDGVKVCDVSDANAHITEYIPRVLSTPSYSAYIKIADGCDNFCTYCIIPKLRGKYRSRPMAEILDEAGSLASSGVKELILVAQDTAYYGRDGGDNNLCQLLKGLSAIDGIEWIRLQYCYPENITDELIEEIASNKKIVKYIDMPLQHISDDVLKRMGRRSRRAEVEKLISALRTAVPDIAIRTSIIVGFPGETEDDFEQLRDFLQKFRLDRVGVFTYSREEDTPAYMMPDQVEDSVKEERLSVLMEQQQRISNELNSEKIGRIVQAIVEGYDEENFCYVGRSFADTPDVDGITYIYSSDELSAGDIVNIKIVDAHEYDITGEVVEG